MPAVVPYFHVHQPFRIKQYDLFSIGEDQEYFHSPQNSASDNIAILKKVAAKCYLPTNQLLLDLLNRHPQFKLSFSITGVILEQFEHYAPEVLESFQRLVETGRVELVSETYYHSLACLISEAEFTEQIIAHKHKLKDLFHYSPTSFRNTELIYNNHIAYLAEKLGYKVILAEGDDRHLAWRSPNFVYRPKGRDYIRLLLKNYKLSDDIAFRFSSKDWSEWPLTIEKYASWINTHHGQGDVINLFMDYETFGEHQWADTGIFQFLAHLPQEILKHPDNSFMTITQAATSIEPLGSIDIPDLTSWADLERDLSAWLGNPMQEDALRTIKHMEADVKHTNDINLIHDWRRLTTSDHFYYMCTKWFADGDVHKYFSPNDNPYEAFTNYMTVLHDVRQRVYAHNSSH